MRLLDVETFRMIPYMTMFDPKLNPVGPFFRMSDFAKMAYQSVTGGPRVLNITYWVSAAQRLLLC